MSTVMLKSPLSSSIQSCGVRLSVLYVNINVSNKSINSRVFSLEESFHKVINFPSSLSHRMGDGVFEHDCLQEGGREGGYIITPSLFCSNGSCILFYD